MKPWLQEPTQQTNKIFHVTHPSPALTWGKKKKEKKSERTGSSLMRYCWFFGFLLLLKYPELAGPVRSFDSDFFFKYPKPTVCVVFVLGQEFGAGVWTPTLCMTPAQNSCP
jgi:hypothetical protein